MKLINSHAKNIFSIGDINLDLNDKGLVLVTGWSEDEGSGNMAGKSSVANRAITWCLFGKTADGIKADSVINTSSKEKKGSCNIEFVGNDYNTYRVIRSRNPNSLSLERKTDNGWFDLSKRQEAETQKLIDEVLGRDFHTFIQADLFGQGREQPFLSLKGKEQKEIIDNILPITPLNTWQNNAKKRIITTQEEHSSQLRGALTASTRCDTLENQVELLQRQHTEWVIENTISISNKEKELSHLKSLDFDVEAEIKELEDKLPNNDTNFYDEYINVERNKVTTTLNLSTAKSELDDLEKSPENCTSCGQKLPDLNRREEHINFLSTRVVYLEKTKEELEERLATLSKYREISNKINSLKEQKTSKDKIAFLETELTKLKNNTNPYENIISSIQSKLEQSKAELAEINKGLATTKEKLEDLKFWENAFGKDLKTIMFNKVCPFLEKRTNHYLQQLGNGQIKVKFSTIKETKTSGSKDEFNVTASSDTGSSIYQLFSGSEKQLTNFAVGLALSDLASLQTKGSSKFMILDEPFLYQSPENCERLIEFITQNLGKSKSTVLLISNEDNLKELVSNRVHIIKRNGISYV